MGTQVQNFGPTLGGVTAFHRYGSSRACGLESDRPVILAAFICFSCFQFWLFSHILVLVGFLLLMQAYLRSRLLLLLTVLDELKLLLKLCSLCALSEKPQGGNPYCVGSPSSQYRSSNHELFQNTTQQNFLLQI